MKISPQVGEVWLHERMGFVEVKQLWNKDEVVCQTVSGKRQPMFKCFLLYRIESIDVEGMTAKATDPHGKEVTLPLKK
jgi:hypothetical protein